MRFLRRVGCAAAVMALLAAPAAPAVASAPGPGAPGLGDPVFPGLGNGGYDVDSYALDLTYDAATRLVTGSVEIAATAGSALSRFDLDAVGLDISAVTVGGAPARFALAGEELVVTPATPLRRGRPFTVTVTYAADPRRVPQPNGGFVPTADGFVTAPQPAGAHAVFPCNDHPSDKADLSVRITAPPGLLGVANGSLVSTVTNPDGGTTSTYRSRDPIATELVQVSVGRYTVVEHGTADGVRLRDVVPTARAAATLPALALTERQLAWLRGHLGAFPFEAYGLLVADTDDPAAFGFTGLETQTLTLYKPAYLLQAEDKIAGHMMHELTHSWFGNSVTPADWSALWLNEGHANYYGLLYRYERGWPDAQNNATFEGRMRYTYALGDQWRAKSGPVAEPTAATLFDDQRYTGGTLALYALRERIGADAFARLEAEFLDRYRYRTASTKDYVDLAVEVSGDRGVRGFLADWLYGDTTPPMPNHPDWTVDPVPPPPTPTPPTPTPPAPATPAPAPVLPPGPPVPRLNDRWAD